MIALFTVSGFISALTAPPRRFLQSHWWKAEEVGPIILSLLLLLGGSTNTSPVYDLIQHRCADRDQELWSKCISFWTKTVSFHHDDLSLVNVDYATWRARSSSFTLIGWIKTIQARRRTYLPRNCKATLIRLSTSPPSCMSIVCVDMSCEANLLPRTRRGGESAGHDVGSSDSRPRWRLAYFSRLTALVL